MKIWSWCLIPTILAGISIFLLSFQKLSNSKDDAKSYFQIFQGPLQSIFACFILRDSAEFQFHFPCSLRERCPTTEFSSGPYSLYTGWIRENKDQKNLRILTFFTQWLSRKSRQMEILGERDRKCSFLLKC